MKTFRIEHPMGLGDAVALTAILRHLRHYEPDARIELVVLPGRAGLYRTGSVYRTGSDPIFGKRACERNENGSDPFYRAGSDRTGSDPIFGKRACERDENGSDPFHRSCLCDEVSEAPDSNRPPTHLLRWPLANQSYRTHPSTYAERCLIERFGFEPITQLCRYQVEPRPEDLAHAHVCLRALRTSTGSDRPIALCHFHGIASAGQKNVDDGDAAAVARELIAAGYEVLVNDLSRRSPLPELGLGRRLPPAFVVRPFGPRDHRPDAGLLAALTRQVDLFVGVDSGPLHLASAVGTRAIGLWRDLHPLYNLPPDGTTTHVLLTRRTPHCETRLLLPPIADGLAFFRANYRAIYCDELAAGVREAVAGFRVQEGSGFRVQGSVTRKRMLGRQALLP